MMVMIEMLVRNWRSDDFILFLHRNKNIYWLKMTAIQVWAEGKHSVINRHGKCRRYICVKKLANSGRNGRGRSWCIVLRDGNIIWLKGALQTKQHHFFELTHLMLKRRFTSFSTNGKIKIVAIYALGKKNLFLWQIWLFTCLDWNCFRYTVYVGQCTGSKIQRVCVWDFCPNYYRVIIIVYYFKGILQQKIFYRLNLIFWIIMGCGI